MKKKIIIIIALVSAVLVMRTLFGSRSEKGTVTELAGDAVIVALDDGKTVVRIEDYHRYISIGEELTVGNRIVIKHAFFNDMDVSDIYCLTN